MYNGIVAAGHHKRQRFWNHWTQHCQQFNLDPRLTTTTPAVRITALATFAQRVRGGEYSACARVRVQTVQVALRAIGTTFELDGKPNPCHKLGTETYTKPLQRLLEGYRRADPPVEQQLAVPVTVIVYILHRATTRSMPRQLTIANLCTIAFYYLLRVGEYTTTGKKNTLTQQFRLCDVTFWNDNQILDQTQPLKILGTADAATLTITQQKNGNTNQPIHQEATHKRDCPVQALARHGSYL